MTKPLDELNIIDDFLMNAVTTNEEVGVPFCRRILSVLLQREIGAIRIIAQRTLSAPIPGMRGIRLDVEVEESGDCTVGGEAPVVNLYDIEPHRRKDLNFAKHNRFYQAKIDSRYMKSGETDFDKMPNLFVITITDFDPFGYGYMMYTVRNQCVEAPKLKYEDGLQFIYFNTKGEKGGSKEIQTMLKYMEESRAENAVNDATREVHDYISAVKVLPEVRQGFMKFEELIAYEKKESREEGLAVGLAEGKAVGLAEGKAVGLAEAVIELLEELGYVPDELRSRVLSERNLKLLSKWHKLAARAASVEEFEQRYEIQ